MGRSVKFNFRAITVLSSGALLFTSGLANTAKADDLSDVQQWFGTGTNEAVVEIDWDNGATPLVLGYRWEDGQTVTGESMLNSIAGDPSSGLYLLEDPTDSGYGDLLYGMGYDASGITPFAVTPSLTFTNGIATAPLDDYSFDDPTRAAVNASLGDQWEEGFGDPNYWNYYLSDNGRLAADPTDWDSAPVGFTDQTVVNGEWDGYVFTAGSDLPAAVPEPATFGLLGGAAFCLLGRRRSRRNSTAGGLLSSKTLAVVIGALIPMLAFTLAAHASADSVTIVPGSYSLGTTTHTSLEAASYTDATESLNDWPVKTGTNYDISYYNPDYNNTLNPNTIMAIGIGGGVTLQLNTAIHPVAGEKDLGIFTAQGETGSGFLNGFDEGTILVSANGTNWYTLSGALEASTYNGTVSNLNAPTMAYDYGTSAAAYADSDGLNATPNTLPIADYTTPMPNDSIFNSADYAGSADVAAREALTGDSSTADYNAIFGDSGGGNWFDVSGSGLSTIDYVRINGDGSDTFNDVIRLDAVFANPNAVPEPTGLAAAGFMLFLARRQSRAVI